MNALHEPSSSPMPSRQLRLPLERIDTPESLVLSQSNEAAATLLANWPDGIVPILSLYGPAGSGKSRIAAEWAERVGAYPLLGAEAALVNPLELEGLPVLLDQADEVDDETLFHLINLVLSGGGNLLLVSRDPPASWYTSLPDLQSRLRAIRTVSVSSPDDAVLAAILRTRFAERSIAPSDDVIDYLVRRLDRCADKAADIVARLDDENRPVTRALARELLANPATGD